MDERLRREDLQKQADPERASAQRHPTNRQSKDKRDLVFAVVGFPREKEPSHQLRAHGMKQRAVATLLGASLIMTEHSLITTDCARPDFESTASAIPPLGLECEESLLA